MDIDLIFKIAAVGIIVSILNQVLVRSGREEQATMTSLAALVVVLQTVASGIKAYHNADNALIIITHNAKILEGLQVDYVHVLDDARIVRTGDGSLVNEIIEEGFTALKEDEAK